MIDSRTNADTGTVIEVRLTDGRQMWVTSGKLARLDNGDVDRGNSSDMLVVVDADGKAESTAPNFIASIEHEVEPAELKRMAAGEIINEMAERASVEIDGIVSFTPGERVRMLTEEGGEPVEVVISGDTVDEQGAPVAGMVDVVMPDGRVMSMSRDDVQRGADAADALRVSQAREEKKMTSESAINGEESLNLQNEKETEDELSERIPQGEHGAKDSQAESLARAIDAVVSGGSEAVGEGGSSAGEGAVGSGRADVSRNEVEARKAEEYAKSTGLWIPMDKVFDLGTPGPSGNESDTYISEDGYYFKVNNLMNSGGSVSALLKKVQLHNSLFPNSAYELAGFTGFDGRSIYPVLKQRGVIGGENATLDEIEAYMGKLGFRKVGEHVFEKDGLQVSDLRPRNVLKDADGEIYVIDAEFKER
ncbi:MAG: hypothetical protein K2K52_05910, partial [Paramuribaculum sp.]|nr:hypothetical protein [Paramuribaculum sp.]